MENSERDGNTRPPDLTLEEPICRSESKLELDIEQQTGSKYEKEYVKAVYGHPTYLASMQSTSWETLCWKKHKLESKAGKNINNLRYSDDTTLMVESEEELKSLLLKVKEESGKSWLKAQHSEN